MSPRPDPPGDPPSSTPTDLAGTLLEVVPGADRWIPRSVNSLHGTGSRVSAIDAIRDGFPGQRMHVLPRPRVREALAQPATSSLLVTDSGYFPHAHHHGRERSTPSPQAIVIICAKGRGRVRTAAGEFNVEPGQLVVVPPNAPHAYWADAEKPWTLWWMHVDGTLVRDWISVAGARIDAPVRTISDLYQAIALIDQVIRHMRKDTTSASVLAASGAAWHLLTLLAGDRPAGDVSSTTIERSAEYLRLHFAERFTVSDLAAMASLSVSHFAALFKKQVGQPVHVYQNELRMSRARELLDTSTLSVAEIARLVGFDDSFYFSRQFRRLHGQTPSGYRQQHKG